MKNILSITSPHNPKIHMAMLLMKKRKRDESGLFLIEGFRELSRAQIASVNVIYLFFCRELFLGEQEEDLLEALSLQGSVLYECPVDLFHKISYRDRPDGLLGIAQQMDLSLQTFNLRSFCPDPLFLVAEAIEKPGNLGTILRSCDAVGVSGAIVCDHCTDVFNPNVVRASVGTLFTQPVVETTSKELLTWLKERHVRIVAATPHAQEEFTKADLTGPLAIVVGTEQLGLSDTWMK